MSQSYPTSRNRDTESATARYAGFHIPGPGGGTIAPVPPQVEVPSSPWLPRTFPMKARPWQGGFVVNNPSLLGGLKGFFLNPYQLAFDAGFLIGWVLFSGHGQEEGWTAWTSVQSINPCGGHIPTLAHVKGHARVIGTGFAPNCAFNWGLGGGTWPAAENDPDHWMPVPFRGTQKGGFNVLYQATPTTARLCAIIIRADPNEPWPHWEPAKAPAPIVTIPATIDPTVDPEASPIGWPMEIPLPIPPWALPGLTRPDEPNGNPTAGYQAPSPHPDDAPGAPDPTKPMPITPIFGVGGSNVGVRGRRPPRKREKEKKVRPRGGFGNLIQQALNHTTEGLDALMCLNKGLSAKHRAKPVWVSGGSEYNWFWTKRGWVKRRGKYRAPTAQETATKLYQNLGDWDPQKAFQCMVANMIEDAVFGGIGNAVKKGSRHKPTGPHGWGTGPWDSVGAFLR